MTRSFILISAIILATIGTAPRAQTIETAAAKSKYVAIFFKNLNRRNATTVYASTKLYCPSFYWWASRATSVEPAKRGFQNQMAREMGTAGFPSPAIDHCVSNSGFLMQNRRFVEHPKNDSFTDFVQPATMMIRDKKTGTTTSAPVLVETNSYTDKKWRIFDQNFSEICKYTSDRGALTMRCGSLGTLKGQSISERDNRWIFPIKSARYDVVFMTRRSQNYVASRFAEMF